MSVFELPTVTLIPNGIHHPPIEDGRLLPNSVKLASRIAIMSEGRVIQFDTPENILRHPANDFVEELIGEDRLLQAKPNATRVGEVMLNTAITITPEKSLQEAIKLMRENV